MLISILGLKLAEASSYHRPTPSPTATETPRGSSHSASREYRQCRQNLEGQRGDMSETSGLTHLGDKSAKTTNAPKQSISLDSISLDSISCGFLGLGQEDSTL